ncbi:hypothetical protein Emag_006253 [Eimeria magna]
MEEVSDLLAAARRVEVASQLLHANAILLRQWKDKAKPFFVPANLREEELQQQLVTCRESLLQLQQQSAGIAAAAALLSASLPGRAFKKEKRSLIYHEATAEAWRDLLQLLRQLHWVGGETAEVRAVLSIYNAVLQQHQEQFYLSTAANAATADLLLDLKNACHYSRRTTKQCQKEQQAWEAHRHKWTKEQEQRWQQEQQQREDHEIQLALLRKEVEALQQRVEKVMHQQAATPLRQGEVVDTLPSSAAKNAANAAAAPAATPPEERLQHSNGQDGQGGGAANVDDSDSSSSKHSNHSRKSNSSGSSRRSAKSNSSGSSSSGSSQDKPSSRSSKRNTSSSSSSSSSRSVSSLDSDGCSDGPSDTEAASKNPEAVEAAKAAAAATIAAAKAAAHGE